jgi:hypothetical protein
MMMYGSFFGHLVNRTPPDPSGFPVAVVLVVKAVMLAVCIAALTATLRQGPDDGA